MKTSSLTPNLPALLGLASTQPLEELDPVRIYPTQLWATGDFYNDALRSHTPETDDSVDVPSFRAFLDEVVRVIYLAGTLDHIGVILSRDVDSPHRKTTVSYARLRDGRCLLISSLEASVLSGQGGAA